MQYAIRTREPPKASVWLHFIEIPPSSFSFTWRSILDDDTWRSNQELSIESVSFSFLPRNAFLLASLFIRPSAFRWAQLLVIGSNRQSKTTLDYEDKGTRWATIQANFWKPSNICIENLFKRKKSSCFIPCSVATYAMQMLFLRSGCASKCINDRKNEQQNTKSLGWMSRSTKKEKEEEKKGRSKISVTIRQFRLLICTPHCQSSHLFSQPANQMSWMFKFWNPKMQTHKEERLQSGFPTSTSYFRL